MVVVSYIQTPKKRESFLGTLFQLTPQGFRKALYTSVTRLCRPLVHNGGSYPVANYLYLQLLAQIKHNVNGIR